MSGSSYRLDGRLSRLERALIPLAAVAAGADGAEERAAQMEAHLRACFGSDPVFAAHLDALVEALVYGAGGYEFDAPNPRIASGRDHYYVFWLGVRETMPMPPRVMVFALPEPEEAPPEDE